MARARRGNGQRIETSVELVKIVAHTKGGKTVYRGIIKHEGKEYSFTANTKCIPVVLGAPSLEIMKDTAKAINNWHKENKRGGQFYKDIEGLFNCAEIKLYTKEMDKGIFMLKNSAGYMGYLPGAAGLRAVYMNHKDSKPYSCALKSWNKLIDNNEAKPFRTMESQGQKIREEMIPELMRIVAILNKQTNKPDPDGPGHNKPKDKPQTKEEPKSQPDTRSEVQIEKETQQTNEQQQTTTRRRRRRAVGENIDTNPKRKANNTKESYCGCCNRDTEQMIISDSELQCLECGSAWERFDNVEEEPQQETKEETIVVEETVVVEEEVVVEETIEEEVVVEETVEEIEVEITVEETVVEETEEEIVIETVQEEMEQAMNEEMKKVEEQVKEELEQRNTRRRRRRTQDEIPQITNEDMHNKETNEEPKQRQDNNTEDEHELQHEDNSPSNTTSNADDISNIPTKDESTGGDGAVCDDAFDFDINADEAGDSFEVEAGVLW